MRRPLFPFNLSLPQVFMIKSYRRRRVLESPLFFESGAAHILGLLVVVFAIASLVSALNAYHELSVIKEKMRELQKNYEDLDLRLKVVELKKDKPAN